VSQGIDDDVKGSPVRLWHLIEERLKPGADREQVDQRIWDLFGERWAVMFTDLAGFEPYEGPEVAGSEVNWRLHY